MFGKKLKATLAILTLVGCFGACTDGSNGSGGGDFGGDESGPNAFELNLSLELGLLCLQSYQMLDDFNAGKTFTLPPPYTLVQVFTTNEPYLGEAPSGGDQIPIAFLATSGNTAYLVFRGTDTITEWIKDAELAQVRYPYLGGGGLTEEGFTSVYSSLEADIVAALGRLPAGSVTRLVITGHSLGGALAVLAAPDLNQHTAFAKPTLYTFAGPRAGDPTFATGIYDPSVPDSWRVVNTNDLVPFLPKEVVVVFVNNKPHYYFYEHVSSEQDITFGNPVTGPTDVTDIEFNHEMCNYYNALCGQTADPAACKSQASGIHGCNPS